MAENVRIPAIKSYYSRAHGGLVTLEDDVLSIVHQIRDEFGFRISVELDPDTGWFHLVEYCEDHTHRLIFSVEELDGRVMDRLRRADSQSRLHQDPYDALEREQDALQDSLDEQMRERLRDNGERLAHVLKHDGIDDRLPLTTSLYVPNPRRIRG